MQLHDLLSVLYAPVNPYDKAKHLLTYIQPQLNEDGSCPIVKVPGEVFDLGQLVDNEEEKVILQDMLIRLNRLVRYVNDCTGVEWFGVYLHHHGNLIKYAYIGSMSKGVFPISEEHYKTSVNTQVFMDGKSHHIADVDHYDGPYYRCDAKVKSEFCCPLIDEQGQPFGIFDCEAHTANFFADKLDLFGVNVKKALEVFLQAHPFMALKW